MEGRIVIAVGQEQRFQQIDIFEHIGAGSENLPRGAKRHFHKTRGGKNGPTLHAMIVQVREHTLVQLHLPARFGGMNPAAQQRMRRCGQPHFLRPL